MSLEKFDKSEIEFLKSMRFSKVTDSEYVDNTNKCVGVVVIVIKSSDGYLLITQGEDSVQEEFENFDDMFSLVQK
jgi:hypothetical protein